MATNVFAVPIFFICFRECLETSIIVSVLLAFLKQTLDPRSDPKTYNKLRKQVWLGVAVGLAICICVGVGMIAAFYALDKNTFAGTEDIWEGVFALVASIIITLMGAVLLRVSKLQDKWRVKLAKAMESTDQMKGFSKGRIKQWAEKYAMFTLPFITVLREGLEAVIFIGGVGIGSPASAFPLPVITGLGAGCLVGFMIYRGVKVASLQIFLIVSTCFLYLVAAGLFSRGVWRFEANAWKNLIGGDADETGAGPGSYDIRQSVFHVNCCSPELNGGGGWGIFNSLLGWTNSATIGSVVSYNLYWLAVIFGFIALRCSERRSSIKPGRIDRVDESPSHGSDSKVEVKISDKPMEAVRELSSTGAASE